MKETKRKLLYDAPATSVVHLALEQCIAVSGEVILELLPDLGENPIFNEDFSDPILP